MTRRKPKRLHFQSWIDQQIDTCRQSGGFDNLSGSGEPLAGLDRPYDPDWWVKNKIKREGLDATPVILKVKAKLECWHKAMPKIYSEAILRKQVAELNIEIKQANSGPLGPLLPIKLLDVEQQVRKWQRHNQK